MLSDVIRLLYEDLLSNFVRITQKTDVNGTRLKIVHEIPNHISVVYYLVLVPNIK
jgi:hypothetical protein